MKTNLEKWSLTVLLAVYMNLLVAEVSNVNGQFVFDEEDSAESEENNSVNPDACTTPGMPNSDNLCQTNKVTNWRVYNTFERFYTPIINQKKLTERVF